MKFAFSFTLLNLIAFLNAVPVTLDERDPMEGFINLLNFDFKLNVLKLVKKKT